MADDMMKIRAVGGDCGYKWDEKGNSEIVQIFIWYNSYSVTSLQFQYVAANGDLVLSRKHGSDSASKFAAVKFSKSPDQEYITRITGYHNHKHIVSLKFVTNCGVYGPYGLTQETREALLDDGYVDEDEEFSFDLGQNRFGGFHGSYDLSGELISIGVYVNLKAANKSLKTPKKEK